MILFQYGALHLFEGFNFTIVKSVYIVDCLWEGIAAGTLESTCNYLLVGLGPSVKHNLI